jgi:2,4-dienoyl-CoA reductase-like NADH-dependent reductase (Old Yellow Enzyme family)
MTALSEPLTLLRGAAWKNRFLLAPLTNQQSHADGVLSDEEFRWLTMRAQGGFAVTMTCAASVSPDGLGFEGQLGAHDDRHIPGLSRLADAIRANDSRAVVQIHNAGMRSPKNLIGRAPMAPSDDAETGAVALTTAETERAVADYVAAAKRCEKAGFEGVEIHGAHGYLICQYLSSETNRREDRYGGSLENRARFLKEIIDGVRAACGADFSVGVRLSPERFGLRLGEIRQVAQEIMASGKIDYLDMSLWDVFKEPEEAEWKGRSLLSCFTDLERHGVRLGAAGKITTGEKCAQAMAAGLDYVVIGRAAVLHHDFANQVLANPAFTPIPLPAPVAHLHKEGLSDVFVHYMRNWKGFVDAAA